MPHKSSLRQLAKSFPDLSLDVETILSVPRVDLLAILREHYYDRNFGGSFSLKAVLPALVPNLSYGTLGITDGSEAPLAFLESLRPGMSAHRRDELRQQLRDYCGLDTEAMVRIVEALRALA